MSRPLILYYRASCHLCEQMLAEIRALHGPQLPVQLVDVDSEATLRVRYGLEVPVLVGAGGILSTGKLDRAQLEEYLTRG